MALSRFIVQQFAAVDVENGQYTVNGEPLANPLAGLSVISDGADSNYAVMEPNTINSTSYIGMSNGEMNGIFIFNSTTVPGIISFSEVNLAYTYYQSEYVQTVTQDTDFTTPIVLSNASPSIIITTQSPDISAGSSASFTVTVPDSGGVVVNNLNNSNIQATVLAFGEGGIPYVAINNMTGTTFDIFVFNVGNTALTNPLTIGILIRTNQYNVGFEL